MYLYLVYVNVLLYIYNLLVFIYDISIEMICECWIFMCIYVLNWIVKWKLKFVIFCLVDSD